MLESVLVAVYGVLMYEQVFVVSVPYSKLDIAPVDQWPNQYLHLSLHLHYHCRYYEYYSVHT